MLFGSSSPLIAAVALILFAVLGLILSRTRGGLAGVLFGFAALVVRSRRAFRRRSKPAQRFVLAAAAFAVFLAAGPLALGLMSWQTLMLASCACPFLFGAVTVTAVAVPAGHNALKDTYVAQVAATADGDVAATITHNLALTAAEQPFAEVVMTALQALGAAKTPGWAVTARGANTVTLAKEASVGSGVVGVQLEVRVKRPHSIGL